MARRTYARRGAYNTASSINAIISDYRRFQGVVEAEAMRIMQEAADMTLEYILPLVPVETGALKESARAQAIKTDRGVVASVSFGGPEAQVTPTKNAPAGIVDYAAVVNYDMERSSSPLFLEEGTMESKEEVDAYIMSELKKIKP